ncbi:MAG: reverse transcriptase/maturase family protein [Clostridiales bacterium]|nr:reverse transcriptase/maturase family protein [Clostridiales bacterium]
MKRHGNLFSDIADFENIELAHKNAKRGKADYRGVQKVEKNREHWLKQVQEMLIDKEFTTSDYYVFKVYEPKEREIFKLPYYPDRIVHHAILNVLKPIWNKLFIYDVYSSIEGKGIHAATDRLQKFLRNERATKFCLQFDISKFYPSVNHEIMLERIKHKIKDPDLLWLLEDIIRSPEGENGIPIGNYTSQYFANVYLNRFDYWIKHDLGLEYYIRYADDGVILADSKKKLHGIKDAIERYLKNNLKLSLNPKTQVYPVDDRGIDFLGYRTFRDYQLLRKRSAKKFKRKLKTLKRYFWKIPAHHVISSIMSFVGWIQHCDGYNLIKSYILTDQKLIKVMDQAADKLGITNPIREKYEVLV